MSINHNLWRERKTEADSNSVLPLINLAGLAWRERLLLSLLCCSETSHTMNGWRGIGIPNRNTFFKSAPPTFPKGHAHGWPDYKKRPGSGVRLESCNCSRRVQKDNNDKTKNKTKNTENTPDKNWPNHTHSRHSPAPSNPINPPDCKTPGANLCT